MFKSIEYKLILWLGLLILSACAAVWFFVREENICALPCLLLALYSFARLRKNYSRYNSNLLFLLNALENGDLSFHFSTGKLSRRETELNAMLNRIKDILSSARLQVMENEKFMGIIVESTAAGIFIAEENGSIRIANGAALRMLTLPVFTHLKQLNNIERTYYDLFDGMEPGKPVQVKIANEREELLISVRLTRVKIRGMSLRIFSLTSIGNELEAREMESWVKLIRVMTHEIMNSIAPISSLSDTLLEEYRDTAGPPDRLLLENTVEAFETINSTARGLLSFVESYRRFTGVPKPELLPLDLNELVTLTTGLESAVFAGRGIEVKTDFTERAVVSADKTQVRQVLVNLIKNAVEAIGESPDAAINLRTSRAPGQVAIEVRNNGAPIPRDVEPHIFVPFFTTKETGTGIGLSLSRYIMRLHGGNLKYHRSEGWTVFSMIFPDNGSF